MIEEFEAEVPVSLTEEFILNPDALPKGIPRDWRYYRIEYGGCNEACFLEMPIYLPPRADSYIFDLLFEFWQTPEEDIKRQGDILADIFNIMLGVR